MTAPNGELRAAIEELCERWEIDGEAIAQANRGGPAVTSNLRGLDAYTLRRAAWELRRLVAGDTRGDGL